MSELLNDKTPIKARYIRPGQGQAVEVKAGQLLQIQTVQGKQVADFVAFSLGDMGEFVSTAASRSMNMNVVPQLGMTLYSNRRQPMFEIVEDTVGRHDMLFAACDPVRYEKLGAPGHANCREALTDALTAYGIGFDRIPDPVNWFMNVSIKQRGELDIREPLAEAGDYIVLRAVKDVVAAVSACPQDHGATNAGNPTELRIRVYRDEPLPVFPEMEGSGERKEAAEEGPESGTVAESTPSAAVAESGAAPHEVVAESVGGDATGADEREPSTPGSGSARPAAVRAELAGS